jgi:hypothetical protein
MAKARKKIKMRYFTLLPAEPLRGSPFCYAMYDGYPGSAERRWPVSQHQQ